MAKRKIAGDVPAGRPHKPPAARLRATGSGTGQERTKDPAQGLAPEMHSIGPKQQPADNCGRSRSIMKIEIGRVRRTGAGPYQPETED